MAAHRRPPRPYRGGKRPVATVDLAVKHDVSHEARDPHTGKWVRTVGSSVSVTLQQTAQLAAEKWYEKKSGGVPFANDPDTAFDMPEGSPEASWAGYQCQMYRQINAYLRTGKDADTPLGKASLLAKGIDKAFDKIGYTLPEPMKTFRVQGSNYLDPNTLKVGQVVEEKGVVSTSVMPEQLADFLDNNVSHDKVSVPFLMEIHVPAGTRVLGGFPDGIETMLRAGTRFKVMKVDQTTTLSDFGTKFKVPKVTLEVIP